MNCRPSFAAAIAAALLATACAGLPPARLALPAELATTPAIELAGIPGTREGRFAFDQGEVRFDRGADRLSLFGAATGERSTLAFSWQPPGGAADPARCTARRSELGGSLAVTVSPWQLQCTWSGGARLTLAQSAGAGAATRGEREGRFEQPGLVLTLRSLHRVQGSPLPLADPAGYLLLHESRVVGAVELVGGAPRLWRQAATPAQQQAIGQVALALALLWDPAG
jgi:hypothetical protein